MNNQQPVSHSQMGVLFFAFMTGSAILNIPAPLISKAGNGAWVSLLISGGIGMGLLACILFLYRKYPDLTFVEYSRKQIGTWLTALLSVVTLTFMLNTLNGIVLDVGVFMRSSMMRETPIYAFTFPIYMVAVMTVRAGIEVMARMFILILIVFSFFIISVWLLAIPDYDPSLLFPIMPDGIKPVLNGAFFSFGFPYAESFLFVMLLPFVCKASTAKVSRSLILVLVVNIIVICISTLCTIMIFGPIADMKKYSLYELARTIEVQEIITRIESLMGFALIAGSYMKSTITLYVLSLYLSQLFKLKDYRMIVTPIALIAFLLTIVGFASDMQWAEFVTLIHPVWVILAYVFPLLLNTVVALFIKTPSNANK